MMDDERGTVNFPARYWQTEKGKVRCGLCPNRCLIPAGRLGRCLGRRNVDGRLYAVNYGEMVSINMDPIEKKPLYHFMPGRDVLSVATYGCNLLCPFCQNWEISQRVAPSDYVAPEELVELARKHDSPAVAFTYTEPLIWFEYLMDACPLLHRAGIRNVLVTNGMINPEPLAELLPHIDAVNVDLKSMRPEFYSGYIKGCLETVQETLRQASRACHVEITTLLIPGRNDSEPELGELTDFVAGLGRAVPLHFSRYFPRHKAQEPATPVERILAAARLAKRKLDYVYVGNIAAPVEFRDTFCPQCGHQQIERGSYLGRVVGIKDGKCANCGRAADVVF